MNTLTGFFLTLFVLPLRTRLSMQLEILALRHQLAVCQQSGVGPRIKPVDRLLWAVNAGGEAQRVAVKK